MSILSALGRAVGDGMTLAAEILCPRDHTAEERLRELERAVMGAEDECTCQPCPLRDEDVCDEADELEGEPTAWVDHDLPPMPRNYEDVPVRISSSAAVSAAADGAADRKAASPTPVGVEGRGEDSDILCSASPRRSTDPGAVSTPAPREQVTEDDLAAHIMGDFVSGQEVDPLTATLIDALSSRIARCLLADFHITRK